MRNTVLALALLAPAPALASDPFRLDRPYAIDPTMDPASPIPRGASPEREPYMSGGSRSTAVGLMIAGGAVFLGGLIIGDDPGMVVAISGLGIGAWGSYLYFR